MRGVAGVRSWWREAGQGANLSLRVTRSHWVGIGTGHGRLRGRRVQVVAGGRGGGARPRAQWWWLPGPNGAVAVAEQDVAERDVVAQEAAMPDAAMPDAAVRGVGGAGCWGAGCRGGGGGGGGVRACCGWTGVSTWWARLAAYHRGYSWCGALIGRSWWWERILWHGCGGGRGPRGRRPWHRLRRWLCLLRIWSSRVRRPRGPRESGGGSGCGMHSAIALT